MNEPIQNKNGVTRRHFLVTAGTAVLGMGAVGFLESGGVLARVVKLEDGRMVIPVSEGYLLVDSKKCQGCTSCMMACSMVHEGKVNYSLARIQVLQNAFEEWPDDITIEQCRQCVDPACVKACPEGAMKADTRFGNVRRVLDLEKCIGCGLCVENCPFTPRRPVVAPYPEYKDDLKACKCDLCANASYHWDTRGGGPRGVQACVEICPVKAIQFTSSVPVQEGESGYQVNLRDEYWSRLGFPTD